MATIDQLKNQVRGQVWETLEATGAVTASAQGKIPNFVGAEEAARRLTALDEWKRARVVKVMPDRPQQAVRGTALRQGKTVYMAVPKLAADLPFVVLDPARLGSTIHEIDSSHVAVQRGRAADLGDLGPVDLIVCGSVAVDPDGGRLGKGAGYADIEVALLSEVGLIGPHTTIATTVHDLQVVPDALPELDHDFSVDLIVTPTRVIRCNHQRRPTTIDWSILPMEKIERIPVLRRLQSSQQ